MTHTIELKIISKTKDFKLIIHFMSFKINIRDISNVCISKISKL